MAEKSTGHLWLMRATFVALALMFMFANLLPLKTTPQAWAGPDLLTGLTFAWALRRPAYVPMLVIVGVFLLADFLLHRPPGLWTLLVLLLSEWLKKRGRQVQDNTFAAEWVTMAGALFALFLAYRMILSILIVETGAFSLWAMQYGMTVAAYPFIVGLSFIAFGLRRTGPGEKDQSGRKA
jgi:rod shape-determining protein MreD